MPTPPTQVHSQRVKANGTTLSSSRARDRPHMPIISLACTGGRASLTLRCLELAEVGPLQALLTGLLPPAARLHRLLLEDCSLAAKSFSDCSELLSDTAELVLDCTFEEQGTTLTDILAALLQHTPQLRQLEVKGIDPDEIGITDPAEGDYLNAGLPPALASLARLESLAITGFLLASLPHGAYLHRCVRGWLGVC